MPDHKPLKITRREVDSWLFKIEHDIRSTLKGPAGELRARLALMLSRVQGWREKLGVKNRM